MAPSQNGCVALNDSQLAVRPRRSKGKSKGGCVGCKQRRVKCDETQPICSRCQVNSRSCVYKIKDLPKWKEKTGVLILSPVSTKTSLTPRIDVRGLNSQVRTESFNFFEESQIPQFRLSTMPSTDLYSFRSEDSRLLLHFMSNTSRGLIGSQDLWTEQTLKLAFQNNFLMHAILASSARHLQHLQPSFNLKSIEIYHHQQTLTTYQTAFRDNTVRINQDAVLGTSLLLCFYSCSLLDFDPSASTPVTDSCLTFFPGIRSIVADAPQIAHNGLFRCFVTPPLFLRSVHPSVGPGAKLLNLLNTIPDSPLSTANTSLYVERIESLTLYISTSVMQGHEARALDELILCFLRWQSFCPPEFIALVRTLDPVALIILAHFYAAGGFVHSRAGNVFWWWEEKPAYMVRTISEYLSPQWHLWIEWPNSMVARYREGETVGLMEKVCKPWSSAIDDIDASFFPDLYNWDRLKAFSGSAVKHTLDGSCT